MSFIYGNIATSLLYELKRSDWLPAYNVDAVRQVIEEIHALYAEAKKLSVKSNEGNNPELACSMLLYHHSAVRNKRCLLAYLKYRMDKLIDLRCSSGSAIPREMKSKLSETEIRFFNDYDDLLGKYMVELDLDLCANMKPPKRLMIEVRVLKDCGEILTESGPVNLQANTYHYLKRSDVEHLIQQDFLEEV